MAKKVENWGDRKWNENVQRARLAEAVPLSTPFAVFVEPTNLCNFKCTFCPTGHPSLLKAVGRPAAMMDFAVFEETIRQLKEFPERIRVLFLHKDGEPLLHPRIGDMMDLARSADFADMIWLTTNGSLLDEKCAVRIIESGIDAVRISIEHVDAEGYRKITKTWDRYDELRRNIEFLFNEKERRGSRLKIWAKMIDFDFSPGELEKFGRDFGEITDEVLLTQTGVWSNDYGVDFNLGVTPKAGYDGKMPLNEKRVVCPYPFYNLAIQCDGSVTLCGLDWAHSLVGGEIGAMRLRELWNSDAMNRIRLDHLEGNRRKYMSCKGCQCVKYMPEDNELDHDRERLTALVRKSLGL
ncbi:MAG: radical SAM/SPASM domain-containing protein [Thermoanaerobaculia bacterium]